MEELLEMEKRQQMKNIIAKVREANTPDKRSFEEAEMGRKIFAILNDTLFYMDHDRRRAAKEIAALIDPLQEEIKRLRFMIDNGLGWEDMKNDITMPHEI